MKVNNGLGKALLTHVILLGTSFVTLSESQLLDQKTVTKMSAAEVNNNTTHINNTYSIDLFKDLDLALGAENFELAKYLMDYKNVSTYKPKAYPFENLLYKYSERYNIVKFLLEQNVNVNSLENNCETPYYEVKSSLQLTQYYYKPSPNTPEYNISIMEEIENKQKILNLLLESGADPYLMGCSCKNNLVFSSLRIVDINQIYQNNKQRIDTLAKRCGHEYTTKLLLDTVTSEQRNYKIMFKETEMKLVDIENKLKNIIIKKDNIIWYNTFVWVPLFQFFVWILYCCWTHNSRR